MRDSDADWRGRLRPKGRYLSTASIHGNFLAEGMLFVKADLVTIDPIFVQCVVAEAVGFQVIGKFEGDSVRGDYAGEMRGLVRSLLKWDTKFSGG